MTGGEDLRTMEFGYFYGILTTIFCRKLWSKTLIDQSFR